MSLWQLIPTADSRDPRWRGHPIWDDIIVRAETPAEAFSVANALLSDPRIPGETISAPARDLYILREIPAAKAVGQDLGDGTILRVRLHGRRG